ncbi:hypothetical protein ABEB36_005861 [Hypothenemus hampei]|uniref:Transmembrane protein 60 n=1 Tax=Hypothenemus hampei TaxID=57062 RepID=A0ABD1F2B6_HYPHA
MVMHRALFTWFILLVFFILLCLRLEARTHWNWFLIFLPLWIYDLIIFLEVIFKFVVTLVKYKQFKFGLEKHFLALVTALFLILGQIMLCLKLEYKSLELQLIHVLIPFWITLPLLIFAVVCSMVHQYSID